MAPALGLEPRTKWLTATYSTIELRRSIYAPNISLYWAFFKSSIEKKQKIQGIFKEFFQYFPFCAPFSLQETQLCAILRNGKQC